MLFLSSLFFWGDGLLHEFVTTCVACRLVTSNDRSNKIDCNHQPTLSNSWPHSPKLVEVVFSEVIGPLHLSSHQGIEPAGALEDPDLAQASHRPVVNENVGQRLATGEVSEPGA